jgi:hypothetical protein
VTSTLVGMTLTHHPVRLFRLSCGCLRAYPMMAAGTGHTVLCVTCQTAAVTVTAYPDRCCGALGWTVTGEHRTRVACTLKPAQCTGLLHIDEITGTAFATAGKALARSREGKTGRA